jgi:hypothetical protein
MNVRRADRVLEQPPEAFDRISMMLHAFRVSPNVLLGAMFDGTVIETIAL